MNRNNSGVGVLDKAVAILSTLEAGPHSLAELVAATGIARPTAHRLAVALEFHRLVARDLTGRFVLGARPAELGAAAGEDRLLAAAAPALSALRDATGESAQLYRRQGDLRICVAVAERLSGLRDSVPVGAALTMQLLSSKTQSLQARLVDINGRIVFESTLDLDQGDNQISLPIPALASGCYFLTANGNGVQLRE